MKLNMHIFREIREELNFFKDKPEEFIAFIAPLLSENNIDGMQLIFRKGQNCNFIYFLLEGKAAFVLPKYNYMSYI